MEDANDPARKLFLHQEALGSVGLVTDSIGGEVQRTYFDPFGAKVGADGAAVSPEMGDVKLGFTGHRHDDEAGVAALQAIATVAVTVAAVAGGPKRAGTGPTTDAKGPSDRSDQAGERSPTESSATRASRSAFEQVAK